jgi:ribosomal protein S12 methylthiotransferase
MRGKHVSVPMETLVQQAEKLVLAGTKELLVIAQDSTYYGLDIYGKRVLPDLLKRLSDVKGLEWIRLHYAFPSGFPLEVLDVMRERDNICNYLDMPLQHVSDNMLKSMRRGTTKEKTHQLVQTIREKVPGITLRTTLIAGYPGETAKDHEEMAQWVEETKFDRLGVFTYSHEEQTHAFGLKDNVPAAKKKSRAEAIMNIQQKISASLNEAKVGSVQKVLIDRIEGEYFIGRTEADSPEVDNEVLIEIKSHPTVKPGNFYTTKIESAEDYDLFGSVVS